MKIDWDKVWDAHTKWWENHKPAKCKCCGHQDYSYPDWNDQANKIASIVEAQLKRKEKRK